MNMFNSWLARLGRTARINPLAQANVRGSVSTLSGMRTCATKTSLNMQLLPIRLSPGVDLRRALEDAAAGQTSKSAFVVAGIGSLVEASFRYAGESTENKLGGPLEILSVSGTLSSSGAHLHMSVSDAAGRVFGGHVGYGSTVRTTAEILLVLLQEWSLTREHDTATGFKELVVRRRE